MKEMHTVKSLVAMLLVLCMVTGILPVDACRAAVAYAQASQSYDPGDFSAVLEAAHDLRDGGGVSSQGEWQYVILPEYNYAVITGHTNASATDLTVPDMLGGADVVGIADGALSDHDALFSLMLPGNLYAIGENALPEGIIIKGYNASYAQTYASRNAYAFERVAEFDFRGGVVDYADIRTENFVRVSQYEVRLRALEAERLAVGKRFFLIDPNNAYAVSFYQVAAISEPVDGFVTITCETPEIEQVLRSYSGENEKMVLDHESLILYDGAKLDQGSTWSGRTPRDKGFGIKIEKEIDKGNGKAIKLSGEYGTEFETTYSGSLFSKKKVEIKQTTTLTLALAYSKKFIEKDTVSQDKDYKDINEIREKLNSLMLPKEKGAGELKMKFGTGFVFSYAGIVSGQVVLGAKLTLEGEVELSYSVTERTVYKYDGDDLKKESNTLKESVTGTVKATIKAGLTCELNVFVLCVKVFTVELFAGVKAVAAIAIGITHDVDAGQTIATPVNMLDCAQIEISLLIEITGKVGMVDAGLTAEVKAEFGMPLFDLHFHMMPVILEINPGNPDGYIESEDKDQFHNADECPYDIKSVRFELPFLPQADRLYKTVENLLPGELLGECPLPDLTEYDRHFLAWHTAITCSEASKVEWPYEIKDNVTFYADSARYHDLTYVYSDGSKVVPKERRYAEEPVDLPDSGDEREIVQWAVVDNAVDRNIIRFLPSYASSYGMPDEDSTLMALCSNDVEVRFYTGIGTEFRRMYMAMDSQLQDPAYTDLKKPRFTFAGWTDIDGNPVTFPLMLKERRVDLYAHWEYDDTITTVELGDSDIGQRFTFDVPADNYNVEMSAEEDDDIYGKIFKLTETTDGWTITGVNSSVSYKDKDGVTQTLKIAPVNLNVPERIKKNGVASNVAAIGNSAFLNMTTLRAITLPNTVKTLGTSAFHGCTALELIDLGGTQVTSLPASMANSCTSLKAVLLPRNLEYMGNYAFANCTSLKKANIMANLGNYVFQGCSGLTAINIGKHPEHSGCTAGPLAFGTGVFQNCTGLTELVIPDSVAALGQNFIYGCKNLEKLTFDGKPLEITAAMMKIGAGSQLNTVIVGEGVETIGDAAFKNDGSYFPLLENVSLPSTIKSIAANAFEGSGVSSLEFYGTGLQLGAYAFANSDVEEIILHSGTVGNYAFYNCDKLKKVTIGTGVRKLGSRVFYGCDNLETVIFEEGVQSIGAYAFSDCKNLTKLAFPDSVTSYGDHMISGCTGLTDLTIGGGCAKLEIKTDYNSIGNVNLYYPPFYIGSGAQLKRLEIREGVTEIGQYVFANANRFSTGSMYCSPFATLETLILPESLTKIGDYAFYQTGITELTIPENVSSIGYSAFKESANLKNLVVYGNDLTIGSSAFYACKALETAVLEEGVKAIGSYAFQNCTGLKKLECADSITSYGDRMIQACVSLTDLTIGGGCAVLEIEKSYNSTGNVDVYRLPFYIGGGSQLKHLEIREGVTEIGQYVFANSSVFGTGSTYCHPFTKLETLVLPESLTTVGNYAFYQTGITELTIPENVSSIGSSAFRESANLKNLVVRGDNLVIDASAFQNCKALETAALEAGVQSIGSSAFSGCTALKDIRIPEGVTNIGSYAFQNCKSLKELVFPDSVTSYGDRMIQGCTALEDLTIGGGCAKLEMSYTQHTNGNITYYPPFYIGSGAQLKRLEIREGVTEIGEYVFANSSQKSTGTTYCSPFTTLESVVLPESLEKIGQYAFYRTGITELTIPANVSSIGTYAFRESTNLKNLVVYGDNLTIGSSAFYACKALETVVLEEGVKAIGNYAFQNCTGLKKLECADSITSYGERMIQGCVSLTDLTIGGGCAKLEMSYTQQANGDITYDPSFYIGSGAKLKRLEIREGVMEIGEYVFANTSQKSTSTTYCSTFATLENLILPKSLEMIGNYAFYGAGMTELTIPENVSSIGKYAFNKSANLKYLSVHGDNLTIGDYAFQNCKVLETAVLEKGVQIVGDYAFQSCTALKDVQIPEGVTSIGDYAFQSCIGLKALVFPDSVTSYGDHMISGCTGLTDLTIGGGCAKLEMGCTQNAYGNSTYHPPFYIGSGAQLKRLEIREGVTEIGEYVFANTFLKSTSTTYCAPFTMLESVILPKSLETIGQYAFYKTGVTELTIPANVSSIGTYAFRESTNLKNLVVYGDNLTIGSSAFYACKALETVVLEEGVKSVGEYAFEDCTALKKLECSDSITSYGSRMIEGCTALEDLIIGGGCTKLEIITEIHANGNTLDCPPFYIGSGAQLKRLEIREGVTEIGEYVFANSRAFTTHPAYGSPFTTLESVILPESLTTIGSSNISLWPGVKELHLGANVASLSDSGTRADLTIYTDAYSAQAEAFAAKLGSAYVVRDPSTYPTYTLTRVSSVPATLGALYASDGTMVVTTGLEGEEALLEAGYVVLSEETIAYGDLIIEPADPQADGYVFGGWYADAAFTIPWNGGRMPACALTLYARMLPISDALYAINIPDAGTEDARLPQGYSLYALDRIAQEGEVTPPTPVVEGRMFDDWYHDEAFTKRWWPLFDCMPEGDLILYGRFVPQHDAVFAVNLPADTEYQSAELPSGFSVYQTMAVTEGEMFYGPAEPVVSGYVFGGWYEEPTFEHAWSGQRMPAGGVTLYGKMMRLSAGGYYTLTDGGYQVKEYVLEEDEASEVYLPAKINGVPVTSIAAYAFDKDEITTLHLPENLTDFDVNAFDGMSKLKAFVISANNPSYVTKDGVLYSKDMTVLYRYPAGKSSTRFIIPSTVTRIDAYAFENCKNLKSVVFPDGLTQIGEFAFSGCERITTVSLPDSVKTLPSGVFDGCHALSSFTAYGLTEIARAPKNDEEKITPAIPINANLEVRGPLGEGALREYCFISDDSGAQSMILNYNMRYVSLMINGTLFGKLGSEAGRLLDPSYEYGETDDGTLVVGWYKDAALSTPWTFSTDLMPDADMTLYTTTKPLYEYEACTVTLTETAEDGTETTTDVTGLRLTAYYGSEPELVIPRVLAGKTVIALGEGFLSKAKKNVTYISIGENVVEIADTALNTADGSAFSGVVQAEAGSYAEQWALAMGYECERIKHWITYVTDGAALSGTEAVTGAIVPLKTPVKAGAEFVGWYLDKELTTPVTLNENGKFIMPNTDVTLYAAWDGEGEVYPFTYIEDAAGVTVTGYDGNEQTLTIPVAVNGVPVTAIAEGAFEANTTLVRITLPETLTTIGARAFAGSKLITADLGGTQDIGASAFEDCIGLTYLTMNSAQIIGENAFAGCILLRTLPLPEGLSAIGDSAFSGCTGVSTVTLPDGVSHVGDSAFENCVGLNTVDVATAYYVSPQAFDGCTALHTIEASGTYASKDGVLMTADGSMIVRYPQAKPDATYAIADTVTSIASGAFAGAEKLEKVTVPASLAELGTGAFRGCTALTAFDIPAEAPLYAIPEQAFMGCYNLERVTLGDSVELIDANAFLSCLKLTQITIPQSVTQISKWAFGSTDELLIVGKTGSAAHAFALEHDIMFSDPDAVQATAMTITADTGILQRGDTMPLALTIEPAQAVETTKVTWRSSNSSIVAVSDGLARAIGGGKATVYAISDNGIEASYDIEVQVAATGISLEPIARMARGQTAQPVAAILPLSATDKHVTYTSSDENVFTVDENGLITATGEGVAQLTGATHNGLTAQIDVEVYNAVESMEIIVPEIPLYAIEGLNTMQLTANVLPADATTKEIVWHSSDTMIADVDANGLITAKLPGEAVITVSAVDGSGVSAAATVQVHARDISECILPEQEIVIYDAQAHRPQFILEMDGRTLTEGSDYLIEMNEAMDAGEYLFIVTGTGLYCGSLNGVLTIQPAQTQISHDGGEIYRIGAAIPTVTVVPDVPYVRQIARVEADSTLTPIEGDVQEAGNYQVTIVVEETANYSAAELTVKFTAVSDWLAVSCDALTLAPAQSVQLGVWQLPEDTENEPLVFASSNASVVSVDPNGRLTANKAGTATITVAPAGGSIALTCAVTVENLDGWMNLPGMLKTVAEEAFAGNANVDVLALGEKMENISSRAFADMGALKQVHLPESVTQIAQDAFDGSDAVVIVCPMDSAAQAYAEEMDIPYVYP